MKKLLANIFVMEEVSTSPSISSLRGYNPLKVLAKYKCMGCGYKWEGKPGPVICPKCGFFENIKWFNYRRFMKVGN